MNIKNLLKDLFTYNIEDSKADNFSILQNPDENYKPYSLQTKNLDKIYSSLDINLEYVKSKYNTLINSDIVIREFVLNARGRQYKAFILYIDGLVDSEIMNNFILKPLMMRNKNNLFEGSQNRVIKEAVANNVTVRKVKKFDLSEYLKSCLIPQNSLKEVSDFENAFKGVNSGNCALFVDTLQIAFDIEVKGFKQRSVEKPSNEIVIKRST